MIYRQMQRMIKRWRAAGWNYARLDCLGNGRYVAAVECLKTSQSKEGPEAATLYQAVLQLHRQLKKENLI